MQGNRGIPIGAKAVSLNLAVVSPGSAGWLGVYPVRACGEITTATDGI
jgi:hypothetical protein